MALSPAVPKPSRVRTVPIGIPRGKPDRPGPPDPGAHNTHRPEHHSGERDTNRSKHDSFSFSFVSTMRQLHEGTRARGECFLVRHICNIEAHPAPSAIVVDLMLQCARSRDDQRPPSSSSDQPIASHSMRMCSSDNCGTATHRRNRRRLGCASASLPLQLPVALSWPPGSPGTQTFAQIRPMTRRLASLLPWM